MIPVNSVVMFEMWSRVKGCEVTLNTWPNFDYNGMHAHNFIEIAYVSAGDGWHGMCENLYRCGVGDLFIINIGDAHFWMSEDQAPLTIHNLIFRPGFFDQTLLGKNNFAEVMGSFLLESFNEERHFRSMHIHFDEAEQADIKRLFDDMQREYDSHEKGFAELIRAWTIELLIKVFRKQKPNLVKNNDEYIESAALSPVFDYLQQHYRENISLNKLAALAYLSPSYFSRVFKEATGSTVTEYIQKKRIYHAMELLQTTDYNIAAIALDCGYTDVKHFTRLFRRIINHSPTEYRSKYKNGDMSNVE